MHFEYFNSFYKVVKAKSISKVANEAHISQPALSQQISKFEEYIGYKLLDRSNKGVNLTKEGEIVYKYAEGMIKTYNTMLDSLKQYELGNRKLKIEACWPISDFILPNIIGEIKKNYPSVEVKLYCDNFENINYDVSNDIFDLGITYRDFDFGNKGKSQIKVEQIGLDSLVLVANAGYDVPDVLNAEDLINYPLVIIDDKLEIKNEILDYLYSNGCPEQISIDFETDSVITVVNYLLEKNGMSFLPYLAAKSYIDREEFKVIKLKNFDSKFPINSVINKDRENGFIHNVIDLIKKYAEENKYEI